MSKRIFSKLKPYAKPVDKTIRGYKDLNTIQDFLFPYVRGYNCNKPICINEVFATDEILNHVTGIMPRSESFKKYYHLSDLKFPVPESDVNVLLIGAGQRECF